MKNTLTRNQLVKLQEVFESNHWINPIQEILDSTDDEIIEIEERYLNLIQEKGTLQQILFCQDLNLDLKVTFQKGQNNLFWENK